MRRRRRPPAGVKQKTCDLCGWLYELSQLKKQRGHDVCPSCFDMPRSGVVRRANRTV